jgi:DsbC/DsbD-like thiol-disulfide interchange protein
MTLPRFALALAAAAAFLTAAHAQTASNSAAKSVVTTDQVRAELMAHAPEGVEPGKPVWVGLQITHKPEWHTYWKNSGDSGLPTVLEWTLPAGVTAGDIAWPTPKKIPIGTLANYGYEGTVLLPVPLTVSAQLQARPAVGRTGHQAQGRLAGLQEGVHSRRGRVHAQAAGQKHHGHPRRRV